MRTIGTFDAKTHFSALIEQVEKGEQVTITKHGKPVAKLIPTSLKNPEQARLAIQRIESLSKNLKLKGLDWKSLRDQGRR